MQLKDVDLFAEPGSTPLEKEFNYSAQCVVTHYLECLSPVSTKRTRKAAVIVSNSAGSQYHTYQLGNISVANTHFDFERYWACSELDRKRWILDTLHNGLQELARIHSWDTDPFDAAKSAVLAAGLRFHKLWGEPIANSRGVIYAQLVSEFGPQAIEVRVRFTDENNKLVTEKKIADCLPHYQLLAGLFGKFRWISEDHVELKSKNKKHFVVQVSPSDNAGRGNG
jgi:hypothetical protein